MTASTGVVRTYTLTITRTGGTAVTPTVTGKAYTVTETVTGVEPGTSVNEFINALAVKDGTGAVYTAAGQAKTTGVVGTGDILRLYSGSTLCESYPIVIYGDTNGDGTVSAVDMLRIQKHIVNLSTLNGYQLAAADINKNGSVQPADVLRGQKYIVELIKSIQ